MKVISILFLSILAKVYADDYCWSEKFGYPCCKSNTNIVYTDKDGNWGIENKKWCGILTPTPTTKKECPKFAAVLCTEIGGYMSTRTVNGCPIPTCIMDENCWSEKNGYPCCKEYKGDPVYIDKDGEWGIENNQWCGIEKKACPKYSYLSSKCTSDGGHVSTVIKDNCPSPTCVIEENCWSKKLGYPCCKEFKGDPIYVDGDGEWGIENKEWCGIKNDIKKPCPTYTFPNSECTRKGGMVSSIIKNDCPVPTCVIEQECWSEKLGYPCCVYYNNNVRYTSEYGDWGIEYDQWCGILKDIPTTTTTEKDNCPPITFPVKKCGDKYGIMTYIRTGKECPTPSCIIREKCWAEEYGYPCCYFDNDDIFETDERGNWGMENGQKCGILKSKPTPTGCQPNPYPIYECIRKGGRSTRFTKTGCPVETCIFDKECWSLKYGYPCCSYYINTVKEVDERGKWGVENGEKCGILEEPLPPNITAYPP